MNNDYRNYKEYISQETCDLSDNCCSWTIVCLIAKRTMAEDNQQLLATLSEILNIDEELARYYLEKTRWNTEAAVSAFYEDTGNSPIKSKPLASKPPSYAESEGETSEAPRSESHLPGNNSPSSDSANLKLLCWNIDGLDEQNLEERTAAVLENIRLKKPDVVLLQEVVPYSLNALQKSLEGYTILFGDYAIEYFNAILIRNSTVQTKGSALQFVEFPNSKMGRHYLLQPIKFADAKIILMTSHFESLKPNSAERKNELKEVLEYMKRQRENFNVVFGGDTNLRDSEVDAIGGLPNGVFDAWKKCGSSPAEQYSWDTNENDNLQSAYKSKLRFDRIFIKPAENSKTLVPSAFTLVGKERLVSCGKFASDHWAIWLEMKVQ